MAFVRFTGVTYYDPGAAYNGFVLYSGADSVTRLIDMNGVVRKRWDHPGLPARLIDPARIGGERGRVGVQLKGDPGAGIFGNRTVGEVSWSGETVWEWGTEAPGGAARQNHDWELLDNGNRLLLVTVPRRVPGIDAEGVGDQGLYEVAPDGRIVWRWLAGDHLDELGLTAAGFADLKASTERRPDDPWGYLEINSAKTLGPNRRHRENPDGVFHPGNILIGSRKANVVALIEKSSGAIVWRLGPYFDAAPGAQHERITRRDVPRKLDQLSGQHNPHFIAEGLPGAGNLLVFDNQGGAGYPPAPLGIYAGSRVLEIDPVTEDIVWQYTAEDSGQQPWEFFSSFVSNAQRLPNGNTLITEGMHGRVFQITPTGRVVWEYLTPHLAPAPPNPATVTPLVYRAYAYPYDWAPADTPRTEEPVDRR